LAAASRASRLTRHRSTSTCSCRRGAAASGGDLSSGKRCAKSHGYQALFDGYSPRRNAIGNFLGANGVSTGERALDVDCEARGDGRFGWSCVGECSACWTLDEGSCSFRRFHGGEGVRLFISPLLDANLAWRTYQFHQGVRPARRGTG
jgi:hypothetical protein